MQYLWYGSNDFITHHIIEKRKRVRGKLLLFRSVSHLQNIVAEIFSVVLYVWVRVSMYDDVYVTCICDRHYVMNDEINLD